MCQLQLQEKLIEDKMKLNNYDKAVSLQRDPVARCACVVVRDEEIVYEREES